MNTRQEKAADFCAAIKEIAATPENLASPKSCLTYHFQEWLSKYANTPEALVCEMREFAQMTF